jgi:hypothetical protein
VADTATQRLLGDLLGFAAEATGRLAVSVKTNLGPEFGVGTVDLGGGSSSSTDSRSSAGVTGLLGVKAAVILRDDRGRIVANFGDPPATDYARVLLLGALAVALLLLVAKGLRRAV